MKISQRGIDLIKSFEGCKLEAYQDVVGVWTIGYGSTEGVCKGDAVTQDEAENLLREDLTRFEDCVNAYVDVPITQNQFDALVCFAFNVGCGALKGSTLLKMLNAENYDAAAQQFGRWNKAGGAVVHGLTRRRKAESDLFMEE